MLSSITQPRGEMDVSHVVNANSPSIVLSGETPVGKWTKTSTSFAVLSSIFLILILPLSFAFKIDSISEDVVVENGISFITRVFLFNWLILALTFIRPPLKPSL